MPLISAQYFCLCFCCIFTCVKEVFSAIGIFFVGVSKHEKNIQKAAKKNSQQETLWQQSPLSPLPLGIRSGFPLSFTGKSKCPLPCSHHKPQPSSGTHQHSPWWNAETQMMRHWQCHHTWDNQFSHQENWPWSFPATSSLPMWMVGRNLSLPGRKSPRDALAAPFLLCGLFTGHFDMFCHCATSQSGAESELWSWESWGRREGRVFFLCYKFKCRQVPFWINCK